MSWSKYGEFLAFAVVLIVIPGPDFAVVTKNTLVGGHRRGSWTALGVPNSNLVQGTAAAFGLSALIVKVQPLFESVKWAGVGYLAYLGVQACLPAVLITGLHGARRLLMRRRVRRALDATTGAALLGFGARLATEHV
jgi:threonine/homoserine/homoserine lactone efflux protein